MQKVYPLLTSAWFDLLHRTVVNSTERRLISNTAKLFSEKQSEKDHNNPVRRSFKIIGKDFKFMKKLIPEKYRQQERKNDENCHEDIKKNTDLQLEQFQTHCDILIIGGGGVGSSIAYWLKKKARDGLNVVVVEKGITYRNASAAQSFRGLNQHFSLPENIQIATYGAEFLRGVKEHLGDVNLNFTPYGSLILASEEDAETLRRTSKIRNELGVRNELLSQNQLKSKFPWLNTEGIALGCHGLEKEGWFDPIALLIGYKNKARDYGAHFVEGEVVEFEFQTKSDILVDSEKSERYQALEKAVVCMPDGEKRTIKFALCIIAAGSSSGDVARLARIGIGSGLLTIPLPVQRKNNYSCIFSTKDQNLPIFSTPLTVDLDGTYFRREGLTGDYLCGRNSNFVRTSTNVMEENIFDTEIRSSLANRVHAFKCAEVKESWTDQSEYNTFDENGIIGTHPYYNNLYIATGFNGHGIQQTPAIGRGMSELIIDGRYRTIDLERLGFDRIVVNQPLYEVSAV